MTRAKSQPPPKDSDMFPPIDVEPPPAPKPPVKAKSAPPPPSLRVMGCELQTAPDHALVVRFSGEADELKELQRAILRSLHPDEGVEPGIVPEVVHGALPHG